MKSLIYNMILFVDHRFEAFQELTSHCHNGSRRAGDSLGDIAERGKKSTDSGSIIWFRAFSCIPTITNSIP
jgi:hypothetical protein